MKKGFYIFLILILVVGMWYYFVQIDTAKVEENKNVESATFSKTELGIEFKYRTGPSGYVLEESTPTDGKVGLIKTLTLFRAEDKLKEVPVGGEGAPVIAISIFNNAKKQWPRMWADEYYLYSNINLKTSEPAEKVVGGANAITYMADGLYASENAVVAHGENIYVVTGQFIDADSDIRRDFEPLLNSIRFIPKPSQE